MQFLLSFFVSIFIFSSLFASSISDITKQTQYRNAKQNMNLVGRAVINYTDFGETGICIEEKKFLEEVNNYLLPYKLIGSVFCYDNHISVVNINDNIYNEISIPTENMDEVNLINTVNNMVNFIVNNLNRYEINIATHEAKDILQEEFFNKLDKNTFFLIGFVEDNIFVSGFNIDVEKSE